MHVDKQNVSLGVLVVLLLVISICQLGVFPVLSFGNQSLLILSVRLQLTLQLPKPIIDLLKMQTVHDKSFVKYSRSPKMQVPFATVVLMYDCQMAITCSKGRYLGQVALGKLGLLLGFSSSLQACLSLRCLDVGHLCVVQGLECPLMVILPRCGSEGLLNGGADASVTRGGCICRVRAHRLLGGGWGNLLTSGPLMIRCRCFHLAIGAW